MSQAPTSLSEPGLGRAFRTTLVPLAYAGLPLLLAALIFAVGGRHALGFDFHGGIWNAAQDLLNGRSPYRPARLDAIAAHIRAGGAAPTIVELPVYPPTVMLVLAPLGLLPATVANAVFVALLVPLPALALRLVGVRDLRCYAIAYACAPVLLGIEIGTLSPILMLGLAAAWRWRDRAVAVALVVCGLICLKLFLWPMVIWLAATRRWRAAGLSLVATAVVTLAGFAVVGFGDLTTYPHMLSTLSWIEQSQSYSVVSAAMAVGAGQSAARAAAVLLGSALAAAVVRAGGQPVMTAERSRWRSARRWCCRRSCGCTIWRCCWCRWEFATARCGGRGWCPWRCGSRPPSSRWSIPGGSLWRWLWLQWWLSRPRSMGAAGIEPATNPL